MIVLNLVGDVYGRLTVLSLSERPASKSEGKVYLCQCECGTLVETFSNRLRQGKVKSCGCLSRELFIARSTTHGQRYHPLYDAWKSMIQRCTNPNDSNYKHYGERGITVCDRWSGEEGLNNFI